MCFLITFCMVNFLLSIMNLESKTGIKWLIHTIFIIFLVLTNSCRTLSAKLVGAPLMRQIFLSFFLIF